MTSTWEDACARFAEALIPFKDAVERSFRAFERWIQSLDEALVRAARGLPAGKRGPSSATWRTLARRVFFGGRKGQRAARRLLAGEFAFDGALR